MEMVDVEAVCTTMISVIIPYYNSSAWISRTLDSCIRQKEFLKEIIIIDDLSTDGGWELITAYQAEYPDLILARKNRQKGGNHARNLGYDLSSGSYIQWLDADDQVLPGKFAAQLRAFEKYPDTDIVYSDWQLDIHNGPGELVSTEFKHQRVHDDYLLQLLMDDWSPPHNYLLKRSCAEKLRRINAWNPSTPVYQDREYFTLAAINGAIFKYVPGVFCIYNRWSAKSVSQHKQIRNDALLKLLSEFERQIAGSGAFDQAKKTEYKKVILTNKILTRLSGQPFWTRDKEIRTGNIHWPSIPGYRTRIKMLLSLAVNIIFGNKA
jgi:glycosyltransferase involved in cell wall biosynthesis